MSTHVTSALAVLCTAICPPVTAAQAQASGEQVVLGEGEQRFQWVSGWARLPQGVERFGNTHGCMVVDSQDRLYVNTDTERAVMVFERDGTFVGAWGEELKGGLHGMAIAKDDAGEFLLLAHTGRHEVLRTTLGGEVVWTIGWPETAGVYENAGEYRPTGVALGPNGHVYVADGYGKSWVHEYDAEREYVRSWGGPGTEPGQFKTPHGIWIDTRGAEPLVLVADRENGRLQWFDLDGKFVKMLDRDLRRPCSVYQRGDLLAVADLAGRVTLVGEQGGALVQLGDNPDPGLRARNDVAPEQWKDGEFLSPHSVAWDSQGDLYVMDWNYLGRITKLRALK